MHGEQLVVLLVGQELLPGYSQLGAHQQGHQAARHEEAERRDPKGLYKKARRGELKHFTGIDSPYERPEHPEITIDTGELSAEQAAERIVTRLREAGIFETDYNSALAAL